METLTASLQELSRVMHGEFRSEPVDVSLLADWAGAELAGTPSRNGPRASRCSGTGRAATNALKRSCSARCCNA